MSDFPRMLFKANGTEPMHGGMFTPFIVENAETLEAALADGWCLTTCEATARVQMPTETPVSVPDDDAPPTRDELKRKATEMGLEYAKNIPTDELKARIAAAIKAIS